MNGENMTKDEARALIREKKKALTDSFNAWSYEESSENKMPFGDIIESIRSVLP